MPHIPFIFRRMILRAIIVYIALLGSLYFLQASMIFLRPGIASGRVEYIQKWFPDVQQVTVKTPDHVHLRGWLIDNSERDPAPLMIYFGGNGEEVSWMIAHKDHFPGWKILLVNYRGYGQSEGRPGQEALFEDAVFLYDTFSAREDILKDKIVVMGRSLGSTVAVYLSAKRRPAATVLVSCFGSLQDIVKEKFPFIPVNLMLKHKFDVKKFAPKAENPMLTIIASQDRIIPRHHSESFFRAWKGPKEFRVVENFGHNEISFNPSYWEFLTDFFNGIL